MGDAASIFKLELLVSLDRCGPSFPRLVPLRGFVSDDAALKYSSLDLTKVRLKLTVIVVPSGVNSDDVLAMMEVLQLSSAVGVIPYFFVVIRDCRVSSGDNRCYLVVEQGGTSDNTGDCFFYDF